MYFQTLENLQKELDSDTEIDLNRKNELLSAVGKLDIWLAAIGRRQSEQINPLQFAEDEKVTWGAATRLFKMLTQRNFFIVYYRYWNDLTGDVIVTTIHREDIANKDTIFDNALEEHITVDPDLIETVFKLLERSTGSVNSHILNQVPHYNTSMLKKDSRGKGAVDPADF